MTDVAVLEQRADGSIILDCALPDGCFQRYSFMDSRALLSFMRGMHYQVKINLDLLDRHEPVPAGLLPRTQLMLAIIKRCTQFIDWYQPQNTWSKELSECVLNALTREAANG